MKKKQSGKKKPGLSVRDLARRTGADRASIPKWIAGIDDEEEAIGIIRDRQKKKPKDAGVDPVSGLTWFQAKQKEETRKLRRANDIADRVKAEEWMATATHHQIVSLLINQIEQLPGKAKSQLGLDARQGAELQRMVDDFRKSAAKEIEEADSTDLEKCEK